MKILLISGVVPFRADGAQGVTAAHIVTFALASELKELGHDVTVQMLLHQSRQSGDITQTERAEFDALKLLGIHVFDPIYLSQFHRRKPMHLRSLRLLLHRTAAEEHFYPGIAASEAMLESVSRCNPDVIVPVWCPQGVAAVAGRTDIPVVTYHGDIDYLPTWCRLVEDPLLFYGKGISIFSRIDQLLRLQAYKSAHLSIMNRVTCIANVTQSNADFYARRGHASSLYVPNTWIERPVLPVAVTVQGPFKIIGHVGQLNRTGGTYGLRFLLRDVMPCLQEELKDIPFEVHIIGGGKPFPGIEPYREQPNVLWRGFVDDLDAELRSADIFCLFNNAGPYIAAYTRHLVAWEAGQCLVTHAGSVKALPELKNEVNVLCHHDPREIARLIRKAATNHAFRRSIQEGGRKTYEEGFRPSIVAKKLERVLSDVVDKSQK